MSQQKKQKVNITNKSLLCRLKRLPITHQLNVAEFAAYIGLLLVNKGNSIDFAQAIRIIKKSKLDKKIKKRIPTENYLETLIFIVIFKRKLVTKFFMNPELEVWNDEIAAPIFDIMKEISEIYKV